MTNEATNKRQAGKWMDVCIDGCIDEWMDQVTKSTNAYKHLRIPYITNTVCLLHVSATLVAILRGKRYNGYIIIFFNRCTNVSY